MAKASIKQLPVGQMMNFAYLIGDEDLKVAAAVDPGWDADEIFAAAREAGWKIEKVLLTHAHFDHAQETGKLLKLTGAKLYLNAAAANEVQSSPDVVFTNDGSVIEVGNLKIECLHTPGHTPDSQCFLVDGAIITGDTLFVDACGRVDLPGSDPKKMFASLKRLSKLPPATVVYPGHDYGPNSKSTIGEQNRTNPFMRESGE